MWDPFPPRSSVAADPGCTDIRRVILQDPGKCLGSQCWTSSTERCVTDGLIPLTPNLSTSPSYPEQNRQGSEDINQKWMASGLKRKIMKFCDPRLINGKLLKEPMIYAIQGRKHWSSWSIVLGVGWPSNSLCQKSQGLAFASATIQKKKLSPDLWLTQHKSEVPSQKSGK